PIAAITRGSPTSRPRPAATGAPYGDRDPPSGPGGRDSSPRDSGRLGEAVVERVAGAPDGADRVGHAAAVERLAQAADMDVDGALVDIDVAAPHLVQQLLAGKHPAGAFHQEFEQAELR